MLCTQFAKAFSFLALVLALFVVLIAVGPPTRADSIVVTNTADDADGSLRQAIASANLSTGPVTITFNIPSCGGVCVIQPESALPILTGGEITIDGYSQSGALEATATTSATILIEIDGTNAGEAHGLQISSAGNVVRGLAIVNFQRNGVRVAGSGAIGNVISGNHIGTDAGGVSGGGHPWGGVYVATGAQYNTIGGDEPGERNVISGNDEYGIVVTGSETGNNTVSGNYVGTDANGTAVLANLSSGVNVTGGTKYNKIGGDAPGERNVISGNSGQGICISGAGTMSNTVSGNFVGIDASGAYSLPNTFIGVNIIGGATYNTIGGDASGEGNVISGNTPWGVAIQDTGTMSNTVAGNYIGTDASGTQDLGNSQHGVNILKGAQFNTIGGDVPGERNVISGNDERGISLSSTATSHNTVSGNYIGTDASGAIALANPVGVVISGGPHHNTIGGDAPGERNVISGNEEHGVLIYSGSTTHNTVSGNFIGIDASGSNPLANDGHGIFIANGAHNNTIGGDTPGEGNVISANSDSGVRIYRTGTMSNTVAGNYIGTDATGTQDLGNGDHGVEIDDGAQSNTIGEGNVISGNNRRGVYINSSGTAGNVVFGNYIGTDAAGQEALGNAWSGVALSNGAQNNSIGPGNVIAHNGYDGVRLSVSGTTGNVITQNSILGNDMGISLNSGANGGIEPPVVTDIGSGSIEVTGTACELCTVELFANGNDDGEGELYAGSAAADAGGHFTVTLASSAGAHFLTATATDVISGTSEFSAPYGIILNRVMLPVVLRAP
jgi:titin